MPEMMTPDQFNSLKDFNIEVFGNEVKVPIYFPKMRILIQSPTIGYDWVNMNLLTILQRFQCAKSQLEFTFDYDSLNLTEERMKSIIRWGKSSDIKVSFKSTKSTLES